MAQDNVGAAFANFFKNRAQKQKQQQLQQQQANAYSSMTPSVSSNLASSAEAVQKQFGKPTVTAPTPTQFSFNAPSAAASFKAPAQITAQIAPAKDPNYFKQLLGQGTQDLTRQYFGPGGLEQKTTENLVSRGLVGQGPEQDIRQQQLYMPFQQSITDLSSKLLAEQLQNEYETNQFNVGQTNQVAMQNQQAMLEAAKTYSSLVNSDNLTLLEAAKTKASIGQTDNELSLKAQQIQAGIDQSFATLATTLATAQTDADLKQISQNIAAYQAAVDAAYKQNALLLNYVGQEGLNYTAQQPQQAAGTTYAPPNASDLIMAGYGSPQSVVDYGAGVGPGDGTTFSGAPF